MKWVIVTGGGSGIGRGLVQHFSASHRVLTCGRRSDKLSETKQGAVNPSNVSCITADISHAAQRVRLLNALPQDALVQVLIHNAAIGDASDFMALDPSHLEQALAVNVVAPMALTQAFMPHLRAAGGRILHLGTSVAFNPQQGTMVYGITKMAFHRLFEQLNAEGLGVACGSISPGMVDTEGVLNHVAQAKSWNLPHVKFFDEAYAKGWLTPMSSLMAFVEHVLAMDPEAFASREWKYSEWSKQHSTDPNMASFGQGAAKL